MIALSPFRSMPQSESAFQNRQTGSDPASSVSKGRRRSGGPDPQASTCGTRDNRTDPVTLSGCWGSRGHPEPLNSWNPWTKIPGAVPAVSSAFSVGLRVTITVNSAATYTLIYDSWGERCVVADAAHPLLTADNQTVGVILEGRSLLSQPYACPYIVCCRSLSVFDLHTSSIGVGRSSFALLSQPLID